MTLRADLAREAFANGPAATLGMSVEEASMGAVQILSHSMVQSIEENSVRKGFDPSDFALVAEGGAGPLWAANIAIEVGTPHVIVPPHPGIAAAMGLLATDMIYEYVATTYQRLRHWTRPRCSGGSRSSRSRPSAARGGRRAEGQDGDPADRRLPLPRTGVRASRRRPVGPVDDAWAERIRGDFHDIHEREYSRRFEEQDIEIPNIRVRGIGLMPELTAPEIESGGESPDDALRHEGQAWFRVDGSLEHLATRYYDRQALKAGTGSPARRS